MNSAIDAHRARAQEHERRRSDHDKLRAEQEAILRSLEQFSPTIDNRVPGTEPKLSPPAGRTIRPNARSRPAGAVQSGRKVLNTT